MKKKQTIVVVDDIKENIQVLSGILLNEGYKIAIATDGKQAIEVIKRKLPDLILMDVSMPQLDGFAACEYLKEDPETKDIPLIFLTARVQTEDIVTGFKLGAVDYVTKPFNSAELLSRVHTHLELQRHKRELKENNEILLKKEQEIREAHTNIKDSITYASRIQQAILPTFELFDKWLSEYYIFWQPRDIVSGDFYWCAEVEEHFIIAVADCTGHGVPGAFMSVLSINFLNEIIKNRKIIEPPVILDKLRYEVKKALKQTGRKDEAKDGLDIAICTINKKTKKIKFTGANNPMYIVRNKDESGIDQAYKTISGETNTLYQIKGDPQPVGVHPREVPFSCIEIPFFKDDIIYLFSDGFADQFGGTAKQKFGLKNFKKLLLSISKLSFNKQKEIIENEFNNWKADEFQQIDDVIILGAKI